MESGAEDLAHAGCRAIELNSHSISYTFVQRPIFGYPIKSAKIIYKKIKAMGSYAGVLPIPRPRALVCSGPCFKKDVRLLFLQ